MKVAEGRYFAVDAVAGELPFVMVAKVDGKTLVLRSFEVSVAVEVVCCIRMYVFQGEELAVRLLGAHEDWLMRPCRIPWPCT